MFYKPRVNIDSKRDYIQVGASQYTQTMRTFEKILEDGRRSQWIDLEDKREKRQEWEEKTFLKEGKTSQHLYMCVKQDIKYNRMAHSS